MNKQISLGKKAIVIGAGIGGLCSAITLQREGWQVSVYERSANIAIMGAGIGLAANAMKVLGKLGLAELISQHGAPLGKAEIRTWDGRLLVDLPVAEQAARYGTPTYIIQRSMLQSILYEYAASRPGVTIHLDKSLVRLNHSKDSAAAVFADGTEAFGDILIGSDGIRSTVRELVFGSIPLRYSGFTALRGISEFQDDRYSMDIGGGFEAWGPGKRFGYTQAGFGRIYWFAAINSRYGLQLLAGDRKQAALSRYKGWYHPIEAVIEATDESSILSHDIYDCEPLTHWVSGRIALLGDAAHPMLPNLGQGGAQAMEDAWLLAQCLRKDPADVTSGLQEYQRIRNPRTSKVVRQSRKMARLVQLENRVAIVMRNQLLRLIPPKIQVNRLHWVVGYEV